MSGCFMTVWLYGVVGYIVLGLYAVCHSRFGKCKYCNAFTVLCQIWWNETYGQCYKYSALHVWS